MIIDSSKVDSATGHSNTNDPLLRLTRMLTYEHLVFVSLNLLLALIVEVAERLSRLSYTTHKGYDPLFQCGSAHTDV